MDIPSSTTDNDVIMRVEIPFGSNIKYEYGKDGRLYVDRVLHASCMKYPFNYGYFENTLAGDGDALDAVLLTTHSFHPGCYVQCRIVGVLMTEDEKGNDEKVLVVPVPKIDPQYGSYAGLDDIGKNTLEQVEFFFRSYKQMEKEKWVKINGYRDADEAYKIYRESILAYQKQNVDKKSKKLDISSHFC